MKEINGDLNIRPSRGPSEYSALIEIWRSAVFATHDFLAAPDFERIESNLASSYFPAVTLIVAEFGSNPVAFAGIAEDKLEMLFVTNNVRGQGIGTRLLNESVVNYGVTTVDVNEQNAGALGFYLSHGFVQVGRSDVDSDGRPYPILHLALDRQAGKLE